MLPLKTVYIHAYDEQLNTATGHNERVIVLSIKIEKQTLMNLNYDTIDCSDAMSNFEHRIKFQKTNGFRPVERITS